MPIIKRRRGGFTILEAMIGLAIGALSMIAFSTLFRVQNQTSIKNKGRGDFYNLTMLIRELAANPTNCQAMFSSLPALTPAPGPISISTLSVPGVLNIGPLPSNSTFSSVTVTGMSISNIVQPNCTGCENERSFNLTISGYSGSSTLPTAQNLNLSSTMTVLAQTVNGTNTFSSCIDVFTMASEEACLAMNMTWTGTSCQTGSPALTYIQQQEINSSSYPNNPAGQAVVGPGYARGMYSMCFLTGVVGGGPSAPEGIQISGSCSQGWTVYVYNFPSNPVTHIYDWACLSVAGAAECN